MEAVGLGRIAQSSSLIRVRMLLSVMKGDSASVWGLSSSLILERDGVISDLKTLATGATARPRACVSLKNQHQLHMLCNGGVAKPLPLTSSNSLKRHLASPKAHLPSLYMQWLYYSVRTKSCTWIRFPVSECSYSPVTHRCQPCHSTFKIRLGTDN